MSRVGYRCLTLPYCINDGRDLQCGRPVSWESVSVASALALARIAARHSARSARARLSLPAISLQRPCPDARGATFGCKRPSLWPSHFPTSGQSRGGNLPSPGQLRGHRALRLPPGERRGRDGTRRGTGQDGEGEQEGPKGESLSLCPVSKAQSGALARAEPFFSSEHTPSDWK